MGNDDQGSLLCLHEGGDVVDTVLHLQGLGALVGLVAVSLGLSGRFDTSLLLGAALGAVLVHQTEQLSGGVLVHGLSELVYRGGDLEALQEYTLLALKAHILGPTHKAANIALGLDIST